MPVFTSFLFGTLLFYLFRFFPFSSVILFIAAAIIIFIRKKYLLFVVIVIGILYTFLRFSPAGYPWDVPDREIIMTGRFVPEAGGPEKGNDIKTFTVDKAFNGEDGEEIEELRDEDVNIFSEFDADYDEEYTLLFRTGKDRTRMDPGVTNGGRLYGSIVEVNGSKPAPYSIFNQFNRHRAGLNSYFLSRFKGDRAGLVSAVTTGEMSYLSEDARNAFNVTGLAHLLSISGTHFGLFSVMLFGVFVFLIRRLPYKTLQKMTIYLTPRQSAALLCIPFMLMYLGISGGSVPAIRSFIMIGLFLFGLLLGREGFWLNSLLFAVFVLVIWSPDVILGLSFQLSFIAVLFIGLSMEKEGVKGEEGGPEKLFSEKSENRLLRFVKGSIRLTLAASVGTSPLVAYHFHYFSVISPLSNLVIAPLIGFILVPLSLVSSFSFLITGRYIFAPLVEASADLSLSIVELASQMPFADLKIPAFPPVLCIFFYAGVLIYLLFGKKKRLLIVPFAPFIIYIAISLLDKKELSITFLDVGQGDSAVIELPDKKTLVVDTGKTGKEAVSFLRYRGIRDIDALVLSHIDSDHSGGFRHIMQTFNVKEIWDNGRIRYPEGVRAGHRVLERGDLLEGAGYSITALHPYDGFHTLSENNDREVNNASLVLKVSGERRSFLLTGDIEDEAEADMAAVGKWLRSDVMKVPHHGSGTSANDEFLSEVSPSVAVISVGRGNSFGHPNPEVMEKLNGKRILRTDTDGAIKITETGEGLGIRTYKESLFEKADGRGRELKNIKRLFSSW